MMTLRDLIDELARAWEGGDARRAAAFFAPLGIFHEFGHEPIVGRDAIFAHFARFLHDGPAWRFNINEVIVDGESAAISYRFEVNIEGTWRRSDGCAIVRYADGLVTYWREYHG